MFTSLRPRKNSTTNENGMTLLEIAVVVLILGILSITAVPALQRVAYETTAKSNIATSVAETRISVEDAIADGQHPGTEFAKPGDGVTVFVFTNEEVDEWNYTICAYYAEEPGNGTQFISKTQETRQGVECRAEGFITE